GSLAMALKKASAQLDGGDFSIGRAESDSSIKAFIDMKRVKQAKRIVKLCHSMHVDLVLPSDFILETGEVAETIPQDKLQMDIGPKSQKAIAGKIREYIRQYSSLDTKSVVFYNGVFGKFEDDRFAEGTKSFIPLLKEMTKAGILTYVGGGEGRLALVKYGSLEDVTHAFTCGGTILKSLTDYHISYLKAMYIQNTVILK
ncbi:MAG: phosphoglycerate kinase, partial [Candidatus Zixiibacteriota bacterium]